jgi:uncharacterized protein
MKSLLFIILLNLLSISLFAQTKFIPFVSESELVLKTPSGDIFGTLTIPNNTNHSPIVLIIAGSGPTNRDCNSPGLQTNAYKMLSAGLAQNGISSLRFDKRGNGESKSAMKKENEMRFETYINDVISWVSLLKTDKRFSRIVLLGHSEGSLIGMIAAQKTNVSAFISVAGVAKPADKILREQFKGKLTPELLSESNKILDSLKMNKVVIDVHPDLISLFRVSVQPYMISWMKYDPSKEISKLKVPVLIIQGTTDLQVSTDNAKLLQAARPGSKLKIIDNMNHVLKESDSNAERNLATYKNPNLPLKSGLVDEIVNFIKAVK